MYTCAWVLSLIVIVILALTYVHKYISIVFNDRKILDWQLKQQASRQVVQTELYIYSACHWIDITSFIP